jgi:hypothetical protein
MVRYAPLPLVAQVLPAADASLRQTLSEGSRPAQQAFAVPRNES